MAHPVTPIRLANRKVFIPTVGILVVPCGLAIVTGAYPHVRVYDYNQENYKNFRIWHSSASEWVEAIKDGIAWLGENRPYLSTSWPLRAPIPGESIPGKGCPGVYISGWGSSAYNPATRKMQSTRDLEEAIRVRKEGVRLHYETHLYDPQQLNA